MTFDPRLIPPDDAPLKSDGEIDLPADLAALGEQLRDDALHLAARYPAAATDRPVPATAERSRSRVWKKFAILATSALATALVGVIAVQLANSRLKNAPVAKAPGPNINTGESAAVPLTAPPTISLTELSGPELEALLDLWQREPARAEGTGVSF
jgi:hypothetical protein